MKKNLKNKMKKMVAGMMLVCSLLTLFGGVSSDGIVPYGETVIDGVQWIAGSLQGEAKVRISRQL